MFPCIPRLSLSKELHNHFGCVNAIFISQNGYLLSSGDDCRLLLYKPECLYSPFDEVAPSESFTTYSGAHVSNVFCVAANSSTTKLYSCGNDGFLVFYDVASGKQEIKLAAEDAILKLSLQPGGNENVLLTASHDCTIRMWDTRTRDEEGLLVPSSRKSISSAIMQNCVDFNPANPLQFVTSDSASGVYLWDLRTAFCHRTWSQSRRHSPVTPLMAYSTRAVKSHNFNLFISKKIDISSAVFSKDGAYICANIQRANPTIYATQLQDPVASLDDPGWSSLATIKTGTFSTSFSHRANHYFGGSDNGICYGWEVPPLPTLLENQAKSSFTDFSPSPENGPVFLNHDTQEYTSPPLIQSKYQLSSGSQSENIINSCTSHPQDSIIVTAGVEKTVRVFSSIRRRADHESPTPTTTSQRDERSMPARATLSLFSRLIQQERTALLNHPTANWQKLNAGSGSGDRVDDGEEEPTTLPSSETPYALTFQDSSSSSNTDIDDDL